MGRRPWLAAMNMGRKILLGGTVSYDDDIELNTRGNTRP
ncbi:hypothetical protein X753_14490 [Mesorhizobium sp. LNJC399B00]|nr:hypothetical protein X753_14490 [Mesorhizobium sp. LNJC399B00]